MASLQKSPFAFIGIVVRFARKHGDLLFGISLVFVVGYAALLFYQFFYTALFTPRPPKPLEPAFNNQLFERITDSIASRPEDLEEQLRNLPKNPFRSE